MVQLCTARTHMCPTLEEKHGTVPKTAGMPRAKLQSYSAVRFFKPTRFLRAPVPKGKRNIFLTWYKEWRAPEGATEFSTTLCLMALMSGTDIGNEGDSHEMSHYYVSLHPKLPVSGPQITENWHLKSLDNRTAGGKSYLYKRCSLLKKSHWTWSLDSEKLGKVLPRHFWIITSERKKDAMAASGQISRNKWATFAPA